MLFVRAHREKANGRAQRLTERLREAEAEAAQAEALAAAALENWRVVVLAAATAEAPLSRHDFHLARRALATTRQIADDARAEMERLAEEIRRLG